jgi:heme-degrading monooxygenase HmoA
MHSRGSSTHENPPETLEVLPGLKAGTFVAIADIELKRESIAEFKQWFSEVNSKVLPQYRGFLGRILIESPDGRHRIIIMTADKESFLAIRASEQHKELHAKALTFMTKPPALSFYSIAAW